MEYWNGNTWVLVATTFTVPNTVLGTIPASALTGTPIVVGVIQPSTSSYSNLLGIVYGLLGGVAIAAIIVVALMFITRRQEGNRPLDDRDMS